MADWGPFLVGLLAVSSPLFVVYFRAHNVWRLSNDDTAT